MSGPQQPVRGEMIDGEWCLTVDEAAAIQHIHPDRIRDLVKAGELATIHTPDGTRIPFKAVLDLRRRATAADRARPIFAGEIVFEGGPVFEGEVFLERER